MKLKSIYLVSMALLAGVFAACNDNDVENFDNQVYINGSAMTSTVLLKNTVSDTDHPRETGIRQNRTLF